MKKTFLLMLTVLFISLRSFALTPITGTTGCCVAATQPLYNATPGGTWVSHNSAIASISPGGVVTGISSGTVIIHYYLAPDTVMIYFTVSPQPAPINGGASYVQMCYGATYNFTDATPGGTWSGTNTAIATIGATSGVGYGTGYGNCNMVYTMGTGCSASMPIWIVDYTDTLISGNPGTSTTFCVGSAITLLDSTYTGSWSSSNPAVATIAASGYGGWAGSMYWGDTARIVGLSAGTAVISYNSTNVCGAQLATATVNIVGTIPPIAGPAAVMNGSSITLVDAVTGGTWSVTPSSVATINPATGVLTGLSLGSATVTYSASGTTCGPSYVTYAVTVTSSAPPPTGISGHINFAGAPVTDPIKVWLIQTSGFTLFAVDSAVVYCSGSSAYYNFVVPAAGAYRVKAAVSGITYTVPTAGYIPTYHTNNFYWFAADVINHLAGVDDINQDINMAYGTVTTGPGFIAGHVYYGANKGTSTGMPVNGMMMYIFNSATSQLMQAVRTDASGYYAVSDLPVGATYHIFPDSLNYLTTPFNSITLTAAHPDVTNANFTQHTLSGTITPDASTGINTAASSVISVKVFPNPANGKVNIAWNIPSAEEATIIVADITGREVLRSNINMTAGAGVNQVDLSSLNNGLYTISVKSAVANYNNKIQVQH